MKIKPKNIFRKLISVSSLHEKPVSHDCDIETEAHKRTPIKNPYKKSRLFFKLNVIPKPDRLVFSFFVNHLVITKLRIAKIVNKTNAVRNAGNLKGIK